MRRVLCTAGIVALGALVGALGCVKSRPGVTLVGIDGASWRVINPMLRRGQLPNLASLIERGVRAPLRSERPIFSPPIWTTIATGLSRQEHGIERFEMRKGELVSAAHRRVPALWNRLSHDGLRSAVVGWWGTYPAEHINGVIVSERALQLRESDLQTRFAHRLRERRFSRLTYPPEVLRELAETLFRMPLREPQQDDSAWLRQRMAAEDRASQRVLRLLRKSRGPFDLELLLLRGVDPVSHVFWRYVDPEAPIYQTLPPLDAKQKVRNADAIPAQYRLADTLLGELVGEAPERIYIVVSDHGFEAAHEQTSTGLVLTGHHRGTLGLYGVFIAAGGPFRAGAVPTSTVSIYDIAPTLLHLLGLPRPRGWRGHSLEELYEPEWLAAHPPHTGAGYSGPPVDLPAGDRSASGERAVDERLRDQLRTLGYIE